MTKIYSLLCNSTPGEESLQIAVKDPNASMRSGGAYPAVKSLGSDDEMRDILVEFATENWLSLKEEEVEPVWIVFTLKPLSLPVKPKEEIPAGFTQALARVKECGRILSKIKGWKNHAVCGE